jgi:hypothetical protein
MAGEEKSSVKHWWVSSKKITILVSSRDGVIVGAAPIARKFIGQPLKNLRHWMEKQGGFQVERLP